MRDHCRGSDGSLSTCCLPGAVLSWYPMHPRSFLRATLLAFMTITPVSSESTVAQRTIPKVTRPGGASRGANTGRMLPTPPRHCFSLTLTFPAWVPGRKGDTRLTTSFWFALDFLGFKTKSVSLQTLSS